MGFWALVKLAVDSKIINLGAGAAAMVVIAYVEVFQILPLEAQVAGVKESVDQLQLSALEQRLDAAYSALCLNPGDPALLERIRELQQQYNQIAGVRYAQPSCELLLKLK